MTFFFRWLKAWLHPSGVWLVSFLLAGPRLLILMLLPLSAMFPGHWGNRIFKFVSFGHGEAY